MEHSLSNPDSSRILPHPYKYGDWLIFPDTFPSNLEHNLINCEGTIDGICNKANTIEECIKQCDNSPKECHFGYFISKPTKICLPMKSGYFYPHTDPTFDWGKKDKNNPISKGIEMDAFLNSTRLFSNDPSNKNKQVFPDPYNNSIFFGDKIYLKNIETNTKLYTPSSLITKTTTKIPDVNFSDKEASPLKIEFPNPYSLDVIKHSDLPYFGPFAILLGDTKFTLRSLGNDNIGWLLRGNIEILQQDFLTTIPIKETNSTLHVAYGSPFYIRYGESGFLALDKMGTLKLYNRTPEELKKDNIPVTFTLESLMSVWICEQGKCKEIPQSSLEPGKAISNFHGKKAYSSPTCFNLCDFDLADIPEWKSYDFISLGNHKIILLFFAIILIYIFLIIFLRFKKNKKSKRFI